MKNKYRILKILVTVGILVFLLSFSLKRFSEKPVSEPKVKLNQTAPSVYFISEKEVDNFFHKLNGRFTTQYLINLKEYYQLKRTY